MDGDYIPMEFKVCRKLERQKQGILQLKGTHLLIICVLKNNPEGLHTDEITEKLTYKGKCSIGNVTLSRVLKELTENKYTSKIQGNRTKGQKDFYKFNPIKSIEIEKFNLSYFAVLGVIKENITPDDFKVYCYLRYRFSSGASLTEDKIAIELGLSQQVIGYHIQNLCREKYLEVNKNKSDNGYEFNMYKVNH
jgi:hypothetical protein